MIKKQTIETQLECRATASLRSEIAEDLSKPDRPISDLISNEKEKDQEETDESNDIEQGSD
jgi:hypothetical protein